MKDDVNKKIKLDGMKKKPFVGTLKKWKINDSGKDLVEKQKKKME
jgi:hypothetical protein